MKEQYKKVFVATVTQMQSRAPPEVHSPNIFLIKLSRRFHFHSLVGSTVFHELNT